MSDYPGLLGKRWLLENWADHLDWQKRGSCSVLRTWLALGGVRFCGVVSMGLRLRSFQCK